MPKIFINYRRTDSKSEARLLYHELVEKFTADKVIMDIDAIPPAADFREYLGKAVATCDIFLALVGPHWVKAGNLGDTRDWVRIEIESALIQGKIILPIIINEGKIPDPDDVPEAIRSFCYKNALPLDTGRDFNFHVNRIISWIEQLEADEKARKDAEAKTRKEAEEKDFTNVKSKRGSMAYSSFWVIVFLATISLSYFNQGSDNWDWQIFPPLIVVTIGLFFAFGCQSGIERFISFAGVVSLGLGLSVARVLLYKLDPWNITVGTGIEAKTLYDLYTLKYEVIYNGTMIAIPLVVLVILSIKNGKRYKVPSIILIIFGVLNCLLFVMANNSGYLTSIAGLIEGGMLAIVISALNWHWMKDKTSASSVLYQNANRFR